eukprot:1142789-Pelagomonas_calceolata.AAC.1
MVAQGSPTAWIATNVKIVLPSLRHFVIKTQAQLVDVHYAKQDLWDRIPPLACTHLLLSSGHAAQVRNAWGVLGRQVVRQPVETNGWHRPFEHPSGG